MTSIEYKGKVILENEDHFPNNRAVYTSLKDYYMTTDNGGPFPFRLIDNKNGFIEVHVAENFVVVHERRAYLHGEIFCSQWVG